MVILTKLLKHLFLAGVVIFFYACSKDDNVNPSPNNNPENPSKIEDVLNGNDRELIDLLNKVRGSIGKRNYGSKTIWSRKNDYGLGLYISANHVIGLSSWSSNNATYFDITSEDNGIFTSSQIPPSSGKVDLGDTLIADFPLIHFDISSSATDTTILPAEDFFLGIVDNQKIMSDLLAHSPELVQTDVPLQMYDPDNRTKADQTWNVPNAGEKAIVVGYPQDVVNYPNGGVAYGNILSNSEAEAVIKELQAAGDSEGDIPYNEDAEFFVEARSLAGMSGGGTFNSKGQLLGIAVRGSDTANAPKIIRIVRASYIRSKMIGFYNGLSQTDKDKLRPFISGEI
ncbi:serine protease family protein [Labilibaculum euxinus]|uniref:Serine protease n=1 Tax=Labilibaculum euxinus TaxID=2686357 RepID=A0A7M4D860_9BACT|nr:hypothetical protein [Labilibaculum euxinus]MUP38839.1 hypothetical protein [Labilibaculum euxinus]MVB08044.1 hypothetical protein [Labilibaculum euxinus]